MGFLRRAQTGQQAPDCPTYLHAFLQDPRVPDPDDILSGSMPSCDPNVVLPPAEELAQEPDIATALLAARGLKDIL